MSERIPKRDKYGRIRGRVSQRGMPDLFGWFPRRFVSEGPNRILVRPIHFFIEAKRPKGVHRFSQTVWIDEAVNDGVVAFFADSLEAMIAGFKRFGIEIKGIPC